MFQRRTQCPARLGGRAACLRDTSNEGRGPPTPQCTPSLPEGWCGPVFCSFWNGGEKASTLEAWPGQTLCHGWVQLAFSHLLGFEFLPGSPPPSLLLLFPGFSQEFLKFATTEAIQRTEIFEYCQMLGRPQSFIPSFQVTDPAGLWQRLRAAGSLALLLGTY